MNTDKDAKQHSFEEMRNKPVTVQSAGMTYRGLFIGADENNLYLRSEHRWIILPMDRITSVQLASDRPGFARQKSVPPGFYGDPNEGNR